MKVLIIGGSGMLGHELCRQFREKFDTVVTLRRDLQELGICRQLYSGVTVCTLRDATDVVSLRKLARDVRPEVVLNCVGIIKQLKEAKSPIPSITTNSLLPHQLAEVCAEIGARVVHFSTDCVFSGLKGRYTESDNPDADDLYGRTKLLGEVEGAPHVVTLRSSIIGRELGTSYSLIDWFLGQSGRTVRGFTRAIYSGFTTIEMARIVERVMLSHRRLSGVWHVASEPISKYDLLCLVRDEFKVAVEVTPYPEPICDRSLDGSAFSAATAYRAPSWRQMVAEMAQMPRDFQ